MPAACVVTNESVKQESKVINESIYNKYMNTILMTGDKKKKLL